jgi:CO dehydrogenase/acetyl-CoA synthase beta subunit
VTLIAWCLQDEEEGANALEAAEAGSDEEQDERPTKITSEDITLEVNAAIRCVCAYVHVCVHASMRVHVCAHACL